MAGSDGVFSRCVVAAVMSVVFNTGVAALPNAYQVIDPLKSGQTVTLTGHDLSVAQLIDIARYGAHVQLSAAAQERQNNNYNLLLEAAAEGVAVYGFNRGSGDQRETVLFSGDPATPDNTAYIQKSQARLFREGRYLGYGPEVDHEEIVRALMVIRVNAMSNDAPSPQLSRMLIDMLNARITPIVQSRGTTGEADIGQLDNVASAMVGEGEVYYRGVRMSAAKAIQDAGLQVLQPLGSDESMLVSSAAYATGIAALAVHDAQQVLEWTDLIYAMDLNGMNSSITPLSAVSQRNRPFAWSNWDAARILDMLRGSYLFNGDAKRIIQDPESLRASSIRQASAWREWAALRDAVMLQMNSSDHNPAVRTDLSPSDSWELSTPQLMKYYVKGGKHSHGMHGYVVSNANWDPYPLANRLESFVLALANMDVVVSLRIDRFSNPFFTMTDPAQVFLADPDIVHKFWLANSYGYTPLDLLQDVHSLINPVTPSGAAIDMTVEDLQAQTRIKAYRARQAVSTTYDLLAFDLVTAAFWMDVRQKQDGSRMFGAAPSAAKEAFRTWVPLQLPSGVKPAQSDPAIAAEFLRSTKASTFYTGGPPMPPSE